VTSSAEQSIAAVYGATSREALAQTYDQWADQYDADMQAVGYIHPAVMAALVARFVPNLSARILDAGVGTGTIGQLLAILGYNNLQGLDLSEGMLAKARERNMYGDLRQAVLGEVLDYKTASFDAIVSTGTFTNGHAPASAFDELTRILKPSGHLIFTVGTVVWEEAGFQTKLDALVSARLLHKLAETPIYHPMPLSKTESGFTTRAHVYRRT
jgi:predicted TPR repeat methyltransferase